MVPLIAAAVLLLTATLAAHICHALREYSVSRLETYAEARGRVDRFRRIIHDDRTAMFAWDFLGVVASATLVGLCAGWAVQRAAVHTETELIRTVFYSTSSALCLLLCGRILFPWASSRVLAESLLFHLWPLIGTVARILKPVVLLVQRLETLVHRIAGREDPDHTKTHANDLAEELLSYVDEGAREGVLESHAGTMIQRVIALNEADVGSVMTPRTDMVCIQADTPFAEVRRQLVEAGHSRVPLYGTTPDDIVGILYAKDLLAHVVAFGEVVPPPPVAEIAREPLYVPESSSVGSLLETMQRTRTHLAVVLDEYGGVAGLVTMEDILEEIVGDIVDEHDHEEDVQINSLEPGVAEVDARVHIDDLNEQFDFELPEDDAYDTLGGFVVSSLGRVPKVGEVVQHGDLRVTVLEADKRKAIKLRVEKLAANSIASDSRSG